MNISSTSQVVQPPPRALVSGGRATSPPPTQEARHDNRVASTRRSAPPAERIIEGELLARSHGAAGSEQFGRRMRLDTAAAGHGPAHAPRHRDAVAAYLGVASAAAGRATATLDLYA